MANDRKSTDYSTLSVEKCFSNHYTVPDYQREYVWESGQVEQLLEDISTAYRSNPEKPYFMGMIVVYRGNKGTLELVDGQQRITTFFIILCAIAHIYRKNGSPSGKIFEDKIHSLKMQDDGSADDTYALELQYDKSTSCLSEIFNEKVPALEDEGFSKYSQSEQRLFIAYHTIWKRFNEEFPVFADFMKYARYIFTCIEFVQIETADISDALKIFETINERGVGLNPMDLLKNMIFMQIEQDEFANLNKMWKAAIDKLAERKEKPLRFLRYFITANYDVSDDKNAIKGILPEDKIYSWLMKNDHQCHYKDKPFEFVQFISDSIDKYIDFLKPNGIRPGDDYLNNIPRIAGSSYRLHLLLLLAAENMNGSVIVKFERALEAIVYYATLCGIKANETEKLFAIWAAEIRSIRTDEELKGFLDNTVAPQINKWKSINYHINFANLNMGYTQQYRIRYILARISKYVDETIAGGTKYANIDSYFDSKTQIEHIMPKACTDKGAYGIESDEEFKEIIGKLGNLTLLEKTINQSIQAITYEKKVEAYDGSSYYLTRCLKQLKEVGKNNALTQMNKRLRTWDAWNKESINDRQEMLYELSEDVWKFE